MKKKRILKISCSSERLYGMQSAIHSGNDKSNCCDIFCLLCTFFFCFASWQIVRVHTSSFGRDRNSTHQFWLDGKLNLKLRTCTCGKHALWFGGCPQKSSTNGTLTSVKFDFVCEHFSQFVNNVLGFDFSCNVSAQLLSRSFVTIVLCLRKCRVCMQLNHPKSLRSLESSVCWNYQTSLPFSPLRESSWKLKSHERIFLSEIFCTVHAAFWGCIVS